MTNYADRYRCFLESLTAERLDELVDYVSPNVRFRDPFNDITGPAALRRLFAHMFATVEDIRFEVTDLMQQDRLCFMSWTLTGRLRGRAWTVEGMSRVAFDPQGRVCEHSDYWDAASQFYERLPLLGRLIAALRRRVARS